MGLRQWLTGARPTAAQFNADLDEETINRCTSTTRPAPANCTDGMHIFETDTRRYHRWDGPPVTGAFVEVWRNSGVQLFDNPNGAIWQTNPTGAAVTPSATGVNIRVFDRWMVINAVASSTTVSRTGNVNKIQRPAGITSASAGPLYVTQSHSFGDLEIGETYTLSAKLKAGATASGAIYFYVIGHGVMQAIPASQTSMTVASATFVCTGAGYNRSGLYMACAGTSGADESFSFEWVKLEKGAVATPYSPPSPDVELAKAQYRLQVISGITGGLGSGAVVSTTQAYVDIELKPPMLAAPTLTVGALSGSSQFAVPGYNTYIPSAIVANGACTHQAQVLVTATGLLVNATGVPSKACLTYPPTLTFDSGII
jgi:hypothetical protein